MQTDIIQSHCFCQYNRCGPPIGTKLTIELAYLNTWIMPSFYQNGIFI